jgi:hypothetical protein
MLRGFPPIEQALAGFEDTHEGVARRSSRCGL